MPGLVHIPWAAQPVMPWANGGGRTRQVAIDPPDGSLRTGFRWRVSSAQVAADGPFSSMPGVDRSLWLLRGAGVRLDVAGRDVVLSRPLQRFDFPGEAAIRAHLLDGPIEDLNVMVARDRVQAVAELWHLEPGDARGIAAAPQQLVVVLHGTIAAGGLVAEAGDALRGDGAGLPALRAHTAATVCAVGFHRRGAHHETPACQFDIIPHGYANTAVRRSRGAAAKRP